MSVVLCILAVAIAAAIFYAFFKEILQLFGGLIILGFGLLAYYLIKNLSIPWPLAILGCGLLASAIGSPFFLIGDINELKKGLKKISLSGTVSGETPDVRSKIQKGFSSAVKRDEERTLENADVDTRKPWNKEAKAEILEALKSSNQVEIEWAMEELQYYAQQGNVEARETLKSFQSVNKT